MKIVERTYNEVNVVELQRFIKEKYGVEVALAVEEAWRDGEQHTYKIIGQFDKYGMDEIEKLLSGVRRIPWRPMYGACWYLLEKLVIDGWLPAGNYLVNVCW